MQQVLSEKEVHKLQEFTKRDLQSFKEGTANLEFIFESAAKHIPVYLKIIKGHIEQLAKVLELETHNHRNLEEAGLAEPVTQLMQLFQELDSEDLQLLEVLASEAKNWQEPETVELQKNDNVMSIATEA